MFKRILVAIDGSPTANRGLKCAIELAADQHAKLYIIHVIDDMTIAPRMDGGLFPAEYLDKAIESMRVAGRKLIAEAKKLAVERGLDVQAAFVEMLGPTVAQTIVAEATKQNADLIVLGTHGRRGLRRLVLGSDAESVLRDSPVPVLLVRSPEHQKPHANPLKQDSATPSVLRPTGDGPPHAAEGALVR